MTTTLIDATLIVPGNNDRTRFDPAALRELADSIGEHGLIQPVTVRPLDGTELYQIVAGERRSRAVALLGWSEVPCIVTDLNDEEASAVMLTENVARDDLDPIDEANAYASRMALFGWDEKTCAQKAGVSTVRVQFRLKLLKLRGNLQDLVRTGDLELGYAQIIAQSGLDTNFQMLAISRLRDNPSPTPAWFRRVCGQLFERQAQASLLDAPLFGGQIIVEPQASEPPPDPPLPSTTIPPVGGQDARDVVGNQVAFWQQAAETWDELGKNFKRDQCVAAATALKSALIFL